VRRRIPTDRLDAMIDEAIVDAYTESEQAVGFHATVEQHLQLPFETVLLGVAVTVKKVDVTGAGEIIAVCCRIHRQPVGSGSRRIGGGREDAGGEDR
jgi:hypothetical protein